MTASICTSCGRDDEPLTAVRRLYVTPSSWESDGSVEPARETEAWCDVCQAHYPHEVLST
ncbi:MAG: hypothetical protein AAF467_05855 [Actinomycetota bacterium]